jgi:hypothetical protein
MVIRNIIIDLDLTLLQCIPQTLEYELYLKNFTLLNYLEFYIVVLRPGIFDFLKFIFENFKVAIWSNNSGEFLKFFCEKVLYKYDWIPHTVYSYTEYQDCLLQTGMHKDIEYICERNQWDPNETIIIDDSVCVQLSNEHRSLAIEPFIIFSKNIKCKNPAYFGPFETMYSKPENLILNTDSKYDYALQNIIIYLQQKIKQA